MTDIKNHLVILKLAKYADAAMKPDVAAAWPEANEKQFAFDADGKLRHTATNTKAKKFINEVVRAQMPSLFLDVSESVVKNGGTGKSNPWSEKGWSVTRQGSVTKALGAAKAAELARAAGSFIGATSPKSRNMTGAYTRGTDGRPVRVDKQGA
jgi:hypothetical protein